MDYYMGRGTSDGGTMEYAMISRRDEEAIMAATYKCAECGVQKQVGECYEWLLVVKRPTQAEYEARLMANPHRNFCSEECLADYYHRECMRKEQGVRGELLASEYA